MNRSAAGGLPVAEEEEDQTSQAVVPREQSSPSQGELFSAGDLVQLERDRIASFDRRTDVARAAIDAERESERLQFDYHMQRLKNEEAQNLREHRFASRFLWTWLIVGIVVGLFLFAMAFFGGERQAMLAYSILVTVGKAAAGAGIFVLGRQLWRWLKPRRGAGGD